MKGDKSRGKLLAPAFGVRVLEAPLSLRRDTHSLAHESLCPKPKRR